MNLKLKKLNFDFLKSNRVATGQPEKFFLTFYKNFTKKSLKINDFFKF